MLVVSRRIKEEIVVAGEIRVTVIAVHGCKVRLGITAARSIRVDRMEVAASRQSEPNPIGVDSVYQPAVSGS